MLSDNVLSKAKEFFPDLEIKYKDESTFMKTLGKLLFFNKSFMTQFTTTIGSTIYFPNRKFEQIRPVSTLIVLLHELVHVHDAKKWTRPIFSFLYLFPLSLSLLFLPLLFFSWKIFLPLLIISLLPLPAYFRMSFEKRAYLVSLYCAQKLSVKKQFNINLENAAKGYLENFKDSDYYFMWPFSNLDKEFANAVVKVKAGERPYEDPVFEALDKIIEVS